METDGKRIVAVLGYGSQGRAIAQNLHDSGYNVIVGLKSGSQSRRIAKADGQTQITTLANAVKTASIICFALPDHTHRTLYESDIESNIVGNKALWFLHGLSIHFGQIKPPSNCDVILIAPHAPGVALREEYLGSQSLSGFYCVYQDISRSAKKLTFELAEAIGLKRNNLIKTTFEHEAIGDLFGEQAVLCGGMASLIKNGFEVLIEAGLSPKSAWLEVAFQLDLIIDLIKKHGIEGMFNRISVAARYGSLLTGPKLIDESVKKRMKDQLDEITSGRFAEKLASLTEADISKLSDQLKALTNQKLEQTARIFSSK